MTRGDKIRSMSDEDLADILYDSINPDKYCECQEEAEEGGCEKDCSCRQCLIEWLGKEEHS